MFLWKLTFSRKQSVIIVRSSKKEHHHTCDHTCFLLKIHHCFYLSQPSLTWEQQHLTWEQISLLDPYLGNLFTRYPFAHELYLRFTWVSCGGWLLVRMFFALLEIACKGWLCGFFVHVLYLSVLVRVCHLWGFWAARCNYLRIWLTCYKKKFVLEPVIQICTWALLGPYLWRNMFNTVWSLVFTMGGQLDGGSCCDAGPLVEIMQHMAFNNASNLSQVGACQKPNTLR